MHGIDEHTAIDLGDDKKKVNYGAKYFDERAQSYSPRLSVPSKHSWLLSAPAHYETGTMTVNYDGV